MKVKSYTSILRIYTDAKAIHHQTRFSNIKNACPARQIPCLLISMPHLRILHDVKIKRSPAFIIVLTQVPIMQHLYPEHSNLVIIKLIHTTKITGETTHN